MFMVMELGNTNVKYLLNSIPKTQIGEEEIVCILYNQLCGLNYLHSAGIMHRNIRPSSFLIDEECTVKICDFGSARV